MKPPRFLPLAGLMALAILSPAYAASPEVGSAAPDFTLTDFTGRQHSLASYRGQIVVLEWVNPECPIVTKHYDQSGNIPRLQRAATGDGVVWLSVNSGRPGAQGDFNAAQVAAWMQRTGATPTAYLRDPDGKVGRRFDARTTPHLFIIDGRGTLVYAGGIDSIRSSRAEDIPQAVNYVAEALKDLQSGRAVRTAQSQPYGCGIKY
jgi:AhpC/TSA family